MSKIGTVFLSSPSNLISDRSGTSGPFFLDLLVVEVEAFFVWLEVELSFLARLGGAESALSSSPDLRLEVLGLAVSEASWGAGLLGMLVDVSVRGLRGRVD